MTYQATITAGVVMIACMASTQCMAENRGVQAAVPLREVDRDIDAVRPKLITWRRDIHSHPELSGQEVRTSRLVAEHLRALGLDVTTEVGGHGVVGVLRGGRPGKVVALRADMDALPVKEATGLPFASTVTAPYMDERAPVMHACGHDGHTAILMGVAEVLARRKASIPGTVKFIFQPAEEGVSDPRAGDAKIGAAAMIAQGVMDRPKVDAIFALHIGPVLPTGTVGYRSGPLLGSADAFEIKIQGKGTHGGLPWKGIDPVITSAEVLVDLQTIVSRQLDINKEPAVISVGSIHGGNRANIIPDSVTMLGTLRTFDDAMRVDAKNRIATITESVANAHGAKGEVHFVAQGTSVTSNDAALTERMIPALLLATNGKAVVTAKLSGTEDFSEYQKMVPGVYVFLGAPPKGKTPETAPPNHSPLFDFDEDAMPVGVRTLTTLALDYLASPSAK
ncbi:amidohydrolase [Pendulispora brunnea]|uniref:Amidohydrolase n=1 Tax=Pendulispora brunnea TaxID=2905690 RepID=A0ABZ2K386_9BACT